MLSSYWRARLPRLDEKDEDEDEDDEGFPSESLVLNGAAKDPKKFKGKLLKFCENRRPPYWGTWTKTPTAVTPRRPFAKEEVGLLNNNIFGRKIDTCC